MRGEFLLPESLGPTARYKNTRPPVRYAPLPATGPVRSGTLPRKSVPPEWQTTHRFAPGHAIDLVYASGYYALLSLRHSTVTSLVTSLIHRPTSQASPVSAA